jgi:hypothetical protein
MKRLERPLRRVLIAAFGCAAALAVAVPVAIADDIPRPPGAIDNRGYELVSIPDKDRNPLSLVSSPTSDGNRIVYAVDGATPDATLGALPQYVGSRTPAGWTSRYILPPTADRLGTAYFISGATPGLTRFVATAFDGVGNDVGSPDLSVATLDGSGAQSLLRTFPTAFATSGVNAMVSDDLRHIYVLVGADADPSLPDVVAGADLVYDFGGATPQLVSRMPGTGLAPLCGTPTAENGFAHPPYMQTQHWASADGRRVFFASHGDNCGDPLQLYMRDVSAGTTTQISALPLGPDSGIRRFLQATPNGSQVFYLAASSYDPADSTDGDDGDMDVYRWSAATGVNLCVTCGVANAAVVDQGSRTVAVSEDGSHVYFTSANQLADAPGAGSRNQPNAYVWRLDDLTISFIARTNGVTPYTARNGYVTPNGDVLLFASSVADLDALSGSSNGGFTQYYRYDDGDGTVTCLSCPSGGVATAGVSTVLAIGNQSVMSMVRPASDDGDIVFFATDSALDPEEDVNNGSDIYEWRDGVVGLITGGTAPYPSGFGPVFVSTTPDGHDVFFQDQAQLTAESQDDAYKLYDARIDGGFPPPPTPPTPCHGDCRGPPSASPPLSDPGGGQPGSGNAPGGKPGSFTIAKLTAKRRAAFARTGTIVLSARVSEAGRLEAFASARIGGRSLVVARAAATAHGAGSLKLRLRLSSAARHQLAQGHLRVAVVVALGTAPDSQRLTLNLKAQKGGGASRAARRAPVRSTADGR